MHGVKNSKGFTIIEAVVSVAMFGAIMFAITSSVLYFYRTNSYTIQEASAVSSTQHSIDKMVRTIREAAYSSQGAFPVVSIAANDFAFYADTDSDPLIEKVHYSLAGTTLTEGITDAVGDPPRYTGAESVSMLSDAVRNTEQSTSVFRYYDQSGNEILDYSKWANVRFVKINVVVNVDPSRLPNQTTLNSSAALRNLVGR